MPGEIADSLLEFVAPLYAKKDTMHDLSHVRRIHRKAVKLAKCIHYQESRNHCCYAHNQNEYEKREKIAFEYFKN